MKMGVKLDLRESVSWILLLRWNSRVLKLGLRGLKWVFSQSCEIMGRRGGILGKSQNVIKCGFLGGRPKLGGG